METPPNFSTRKVHKQSNWSSNTMNVQHAHPSDLESIEALLDELDLPHEDLTAAHLDDFLVCRSGGDLAGVVGLERYGGIGLLRSLGVRADRRGSGLGTHLTNRIEVHARLHDVNDIYLLTTTAAGFFRSRGYDRIERDDLPSAIQETEEVAQLCPESATCMHKRLS